MKTVVSDDAHCGREIQAAHFPPDGNRITRIGGFERFGQPAGFRTEKQEIPGTNPGLGVGHSRMGTERVDAMSRLRPLQKCAEMAVVPHIHFPPVIQARPLEVPIIDPETKGMDQMQSEFCCGTETGDVPRIEWYFRLVKDHMKAGIFKGTMLYFRDIPFH